MKIKVRNTRTRWAVALMIGFWLVPLHAALGSAEFNGWLWLTLEAQSNKGQSYQEGTVNFIIDVPDDYRPAPGIDLISFSGRGEELYHIVKGWRTRLQFWPPGDPDEKFLRFELWRSRPNRYPRRLLETMDRNDLARVKPTPSLRLRTSHRCWQGGRRAF